jgi:hypothetical protein
VWAAYRLHKADEFAIASPRQLVLKWTKGKRWPDIVQYIGIQKAIIEAGYLADLNDTIYIDRDVFRGLKKKELTWRDRDQRWQKHYKGRLLYFSGKGGEEASYERALEEFRAKKEEIDHEIFLSGQQKGG